VEDAPSRFAALLSERDGTEQHPDLSWNARAYVAHVSDATRIWAERVAGAALGATEPVMPYEEDDLGAVRGYEGLALQGALWSLERAIGDWREAEALAATSQGVLLHPEQGQLSLGEVRRIVVHEIEHHAFDLTRILTR
jgi:hypothetical protein